MSITTTYKFGSTSTPGSDNLSFDYTLANSDILGFSAAYNSKEGITKDTWSSGLLILDGVTSDILKKSKTLNYIDTTHVTKMNGLDGSSSSVELTTANINTTDCPLLFTWGDSTVNTTIESPRFFAYDLNADYDTAPTGITVVGFEHTGTTIRKNKVGDSSGKAWNSQYGIGGRGNALSLLSQASSETHSFYLNFSIKPTAYGNSTFGFCIQFDVS